MMEMTGLAQTMAEQSPTTSISPDLDAFASVRNDSGYGRDAFQCIAIDFQCRLLLPLGLLPRYDPSNYHRNISLSALKVASGRPDAGCTTTSTLSVHHELFTRHACITIQLKERFRACVSSRLAVFNTRSFGYRYSPALNCFFNICA